MVYLIDEKLRPQANYPIYPPYHQGLYIEEYFFSKYKEELSDRKYIDIFWTNLYCNKDYTGSDKVNIQSELNKLDPYGKYFTVCQHDDGPKENLPKDTLIFSAGGNRKNGNIVPIPLICSPIPPTFLPQKAEKHIFASFVGSMTHPIREKIYHAVYNKPDYVLLMCNWSNTVPQQNLIKFIDVTSSSKFSLCPRGYGPTSFRMYEILQLGSVPVYVSNDHYLPWCDDLTWSDFCVIISESEIDKIDEILKSIDDDKYAVMLSKGKEVYQEYFTLDGMVNNIIKRL